MFHVPAIGTAAHLYFCRASPKGVKKTKHENMKREQNFDLYAGKVNTSERFQVLGKNGNTSNLNSSGVLARRPNEYSDYFCLFRSFPRISN